MESTQENPAQEELGSEVLESLGEPKEAMNEVDTSHESEGVSSDNDPLYVQKRLKQQKRAHERELRELHARISDMQSRTAPQTEHNTENPYSDPESGGIDETIHKAVSYALGHRDREESKAKQAQQQAHVNKQYQELQKHLDNTADKYDDFDEVVRGEDAHFTPHMRDASLLLPKSGSGAAGEVLYKLGKNPAELSRIANLHPLDQAAEMVRLSHAMIGGGESKTTQSPRTLGQVKHTPSTNSHIVTEKTPIGNIRERMKSGTWK